MNIAEALLLGCALWAVVALVALLLVRSALLSFAGWVRREFLLDEDLTEIRQRVQEERLADSSEDP